MMYYSLCLSHGPKMACCPWGEMENLYYGLASTHVTNEYSVNMHILERLSKFLLLIQIDVAKEASKGAWITEERSTSPLLINCKGADSYSGMRKFMIGMVHFLCSILYIIIIIIALIFRKNYTDATALSGTDRCGGFCKTNTILL